MLSPICIELRQSKEFTENTNNDSKLRTLEITIKFKQDGDDD